MEELRKVENAVTGILEDDRDSSNEKIDTVKETNKKIVNKIQKQTNIDYNIENILATIQLEESDGGQFSPMWNLSWVEDENEKLKVICHISKFDIIIET